MQMQAILQEPTSFTALADPLMQQHQAYPQQQGILQQILNHTMQGSKSTWLLKPFIQVKGIDMNCALPLTDVRSHIL
jgi:hypothetical protein